MGHQKNGTSSAETGADRPAHGKHVDHKQRAASHIRRLLDRTALQTRHAARGACRGGGLRASAGPVIVWPARNMEMRLDRCVLEDMIGGGGAVRRRNGTSSGDIEEHIESVDGSDEEEEEVLSEWEAELAAMGPARFGFGLRLL